MKVPQIKNELKGIHTDYIQYKYNLLHKKAFKQIVFIYSYLMICNQTVKDE